LAGGERLLWTGRPPRGLLLRRSDATVIPFSVMWTGFACFWEWNVLRSKSAFMVLWGVPFVLLGVYFTFARFFWDAAQRARTCYAVTNRRALILTRLGRRRLRSVSLCTVLDLELEVRRDGTGTLRFNTGAARPRRTRGGDDHQEMPCFERIADARAVQALILEVQLALRGHSAAGAPRPASQCLLCGYDLRGQTEARCPECGTAFDNYLLASSGRRGGAGATAPTP